MNLFHPRDPDISAQNTPKTIAIIILSVTFFGVLFFILVRNALRRKLDILVEEEKKRKLDNLD